MAHFGTNLALRSHRTIQYGSLAVLGFVSKLYARLKPLQEAW
jgi:hypothetical protein